MIFEDISFSPPQNRPLFYTSFVSTLDGKIFVKNPGYWPIGSKTDYELFTYLRAHADAIIDGKQTARVFGQKTIETIHTASFLSLRQKLGKKNTVEYLILTKNPDSVSFLSDNPYNYKPTIATYNSLKNLCENFRNKKYQLIFIDGGPTLLRSFIWQGLLDELFLTISPKIFGGKSDEFLTMVEGELFQPNSIPHMKLDSVKEKDDEVFLHYKMTR